MNVKLVERLARLEPWLSPGIAQEAGAFIQIHSDPAFEWNIARAFPRARMTFPVTVIGRDHWLFSAYSMHLDPVASATATSKPHYKSSSSPVYRGN